LPIDAFDLMSSVASMVPWDLRLTLANLDRLGQPVKDLVGQFYDGTDGIGVVFDIELMLVVLTDSEDDRAEEEPDDDFRPRRDY